MRKASIFILFSFISSISYCLTLSDIKTEVRKHANDTANPKIIHTENTLDDLINEGQKDIVNRSWCLMISSGYVLTPRTTYYSLPNDLIAIAQIKFINRSSLTKELREITERALVQENPDYDRQVGEPTRYFTRFSTTNAKPLEISYNPVPTASSTGTVIINYYRQATDLSATTDVPFDGLRWLYPYHYSLVYYTLWRIKMMEGSLDEATNYQQLYNAYVTLMIDRLGRIPNYSPGFSVGEGIRTSTGR